MSKTSIDFPVRRPATLTVASVIAYRDRLRSLLSDTRLCEVDSSTDPEPVCESAARRLSMLVDEVSRIAWQPAAKAELEAAGF